MEFFRSSRLALFILVVTTVGEFFTPSLALAGETDLPPTPTATLPVDSRTGGELATELVITSLSRLRERLELFTPDILPHQVKYRDRKLRKQILYVRTYLDLHAFHFALVPGPDGQELRDPWRELRKDLDVGYGLVGDFKDLYDVVHRRIGKNDFLETITLEDYGRAYRIPPARLATSWLIEEIELRRARVLRWLEAFDFDGYLRELRSGSLAPILETRLEERRDRDDLSRLYWGGIEARPSTRLSGLDNLRRLGYLLMTDLLLQDLAGEAARIEDIIEEQEIFHDLRKRIRAVIQLPGLEGFEDLLGEEDLASACFQRLESTVDAFGDLNDLIARHALFVHLEERQGDPEFRARLEVWKEETLTEIDYQLRSMQGFFDPRATEEAAFDLAALFLRRIQPTAGQRPPPSPPHLLDLDIVPESNVVFATYPDPLGADELPFAVEIPRGSTHKTELRTATGQVIVDRVLCPREVHGTDRTVHAYPASYGIAPGRFNIDGDPLDLLVLGRDDIYRDQVENNRVGLRRVRVVGVLQMQECEAIPCQETDWLDDWKVIAVDVEDPEVGSIRSIEELPAALESLIEFFENYKGRVSGHPLTRIQGHLEQEAAIGYVSGFETIAPATRKREVELCSGLFEALLDQRDALMSQARPDVSETYIDCLERVFYPEFFEDSSRYDFFIRFTAYQLLRQKLDVDGATMARALPLMEELRKMRRTHYRFVAHDLPAPGSGNAIFEWVKTQNRNVGCPPGFPPQHYESLEIAPPFEKLVRQALEEAPPPVLTDETR